jgi:hypothetical protein
MKNLIRVVVLALGIVSLSFFITSVRVAASDIAPQNTGVPMPALSELPWEMQHKVIAGEFLYMLAGYYYQDGRKWNWIYETNRDRIADPNRIYPGQVLIIRLPRGWTPPMSYKTWYDRMREQYSGQGAKTPATGIPPAIGPGKETPGT